MSDETELDRDLYFPPVIYKGADAAVFWDVQDYPIPDEADAESFLKEIQKALEDFYCGKVSIYAYARKYLLSDDLVRKFEEAEITIHDISMLGRIERTWSMLVDIHAWAIRRTKKTINLIVLSKQFPKDLVLYLEGLYARYFGVFLSKTEEHWELPRESAVSFLTNKFLKRTRGTETGTRREDFRRLMFLSSIRPLDESFETLTGDLPMADGIYHYCCVFWLMEDASILEQTEPCEMLRRLRNSLWARGYTGCLVIRGLVLNGDTLSDAVINDYWSHGFGFNRQKKGAGCNQLFVKMLVVALTYANERTNIVILLDGQSHSFVQASKFREVCESLQERGFSVVVARSDKLINGANQIETRSQTLVSCVTEEC